MKFSIIALVAVQVVAVIAAPHNGLRRGRGRGNGRAIIADPPAANVTGPIIEGPGAGNATAGAEDEAAAGGEEEAAAGGEEEEGEGNEVDLAGVFGTAVELGGGDIKQDVLYTKSDVGAFEVEFANTDARTLTVTENKTPADPPTGFVALEPSSFQVELTGGADGLTLQKIDYIFDPASAALAGIDLTKSVVGRLCTETNSFIVDTAALGEQEFEVDENEITLTVNNMIGEWGIFAPVAGEGDAAADDGDAAAGDDAATGEGDAAAGDGDAAAGEEEAAAGGEEGSGAEIDAVGIFGTGIEVLGGNQKTDILYPPSLAGSLEVEIKAIAANTITVVAGAPSGKAPDGFLFVDPQTFKISTASATSEATDVVKVDYIFTKAVIDAADVTMGIIGKFDAATNTYITEGLGEFELEADENEWTLTTTDLNGEWAILIPRAAQKVAA